MGAIESISSNAETIPIRSLVGQHTLAGWDGPVQVDWVISDDWREELNAVRFVIDGRTVLAVEDLQDNYRSALNGLLTSSVPVVNTFPPCRVLCSMTDGEDLYVLEMRDMATGKTVARIGTDSTDNWYPFVVFDFDPTAMAVNAGKADKEEPRP